MARQTHMLRILIRWGLCLALMVLLGPRTAQATEQPALTLMVYMCGSNLESKGGAGSRDLLEMVSSGYDQEAVRVLVMTGGAKRWALGMPKDALCIYTPDGESLRMMEAFEGASMGDPSSLNTLITYGYENYPAQHYALILWNHGGGPLNGVCIDELYDSDTLSMEELVAGLQASPAAAEPLEWIGFDACLMGSAEVASLMSPFAHYMIASEETEPGGGWDYSFLYGIQEDESGAETGRRIVDGYMAASQDGFDLTLSCIDLTALDDLRTSLDDLFSSLEISGGNYAFFSYAAGNTRAFGKAAGDDYSYDLIDLAALTEALRAQENDYAQEVLQALSDAVVYSRSTGESGGLSIYHPYANQEAYTASWAALYPSLDFSEGYTGYVDRFAAYLFGNADVSWQQLRALPTQSPEIFALPLSSQQEGFLSDAVMHILSWDETAEAYTDVCSVGQLTLEEGVLYGALSDRMLVAADASDAALTQAIPYEMLPDGSFSIYCNYCSQEGAGTPAAGELIPGDPLGQRRDFGSYSFDTEDASTSGMSANQSGVQISHSSPMEAEALETLSVPQSVTLSQNASPTSGVGSVFSLQHDLSEEAAVTITPVHTQTLSGGSVAQISQAGSGISVLTLTPASTQSFSPAQLVISLSGVDLSQGEETEPRDVVHARLRCSLDEDGHVTILETWLYDEESGIWSTRSSITPEDYPITVFPVARRQLPQETDTLPGYPSWPVADTTFYSVSISDWHLAFHEADQQSNLCVSFEVTDLQSQTYCSMPLAVSVTTS